MERSENMKADMVVGGFYGDEGKGRIVGHLAVRDNYDCVVRAGGGPQAGHTVTRGKKVTQIPSGFINPHSRLLIGRGTAINPEIVLNEIKQFGVESRIGIDYGCTIIEPRHLGQESGLVERIGSVGTGTGPARVERIWRTAKLAKDIESLKPYLTDVSDEINGYLASDKKVLIEGVQAYGLSLLNYEFYPFVTSQATEASQFAADADIGPKAIGEIYVVYKAYVSRVGKGFMHSEWTEEQAEQCGISEKGTVSGRIRRLGDFDMNLAKKSMVGNTGTQAAITCIDRLFEGNSNIIDFNKLTPEAKNFLDNISTCLKDKSPYFNGITLISTGPNLEDTIDLRFLS